jgi:hypothetical protein
MGTLRVIAFFSCAVMLAFPAGAAQGETGLARSAPSAWITPLEWKADVNPSTTSGYVDRLIDFQVNRETEELYIHIVYLIASTNVLSEGSTITISFDPSFQAVTLHTIKRWRQGEMLSQEDAEFKKIQREESLEDSLFSGVQSWVAFLKDVAVGDTIEEAYTVRGFNPLFKGKYCDEFSLQGSTPVQRFSLRMVFNAGRAPVFKTFNTGLQGRVTESGNMREYLLDAKDLDPIEYEPSLPYGFQPGARVEVSEFDSWSQVVSWGLELYSTGDEESVGTKTQALLTGVTDPEKKVLTLLEYIQDEIRYLGIETGLNSHQPHAPAEVLANRFGDCKDKVALFCAMARNAGIRAWPVLVNTWRRELVRRDVPSPLSFNHVIAAVDWGGKLIFLDPTVPLQGGPLDRRGLGDFGWGLILRQDTRGLQELPSPRVLSIVKTERFLVKDLSGPAEMEAQYVFSDGAADSFRAYLSGRSLEDLRKDYQEIFQDQYKQGTMKANPSFSDDRAVNRLEFRLNFEIAGFVTTDGNRREIDLYPSLIADRLRDPETVSTRTQPMYIEHPVVISQHQVIELPESWRLARVDHSVADPSFRVTSSTSSSGMTVSVDSEFKSLSDRVDPAHWSFYLGNLEKSRKAIDWAIWNDTPPPAEKSQAPESPTTAIGGFLGMVIIFFLAAFQMGADF